MRTLVKWLRRLLASLAVLILAIIALTIVTSLTSKASHDSSEDATHVEAGSEPNASPNSFRVETKPTSLEVHVSYRDKDDRDYSFTTPADLDVPVGTEIRYQIDEDIDHGLKAAEGTFLAPKAGETASIYVAQMTANEEAAAKSAQAAGEADQALP